MSHNDTPGEASAADAKKVPDYDQELAFYHAAFAPELEQAVGDVPLTPDARVLDIPCGDGFYTQRLAARIGPAGKVVGADHLPAYLERGAEEAQRANTDHKSDFVQADAYRLDFGDATFDVVWCAQSFISLDDPACALAEIFRILKSGGRIAVLETDELHHLLLPWPAALELRIQEAWRAASREMYRNASRTYVGRRMRGLLQQAGFAPIRRTSYVADREAPLSETDRGYFRVYLRELARAVRPHLGDRDRQTFEALTDPDSERYLLRQPDFEAACLFTLWQGDKPR